MNIYPALRARMGSWQYYIVRMTARELSETVKFAHDIYDDQTLGQAMQRILSESRVNKEIVQYLVRQPNRFFSSLVVAAVDGDPQFYPVEITDDPQFKIFRNNRRLKDTFGVLTFDGSQTYYALDGQHRLAAVNKLLDPQDPASDAAPENFGADEFSVVIVVPDEEADESFNQKYRRLFSNLNRYAKPMDGATNIIMDEDDVFAILTRRIISEHDFFHWNGREQESQKVKTVKGKGLTEKDVYFTSLETLYAMNIELLSSCTRENSGWGPAGQEGEQLTTFKRFRPDEDYIDSLYAELLMYWNALLAEVGDLHSTPSKMRHHNPSEEEAEEQEYSDHVLFWPIGQEMLAAIVRQLLDQKLPNPESPKPGSVREAIAGLGQLEWRLHQPPWKYFLLVQDDKGKWKMRSEERKVAIRLGQRIQQWVMGADEREDEGIEKSLRAPWASMLIPQPSQKEKDNMWSEVQQRHADVVSSLES